MKILKNLLLILIIIVPINTYAFTLPELYSRNVLIYEPKTNRIIYEDNGDEVVNIASLTKIMTTIVAIENIKDLDEYVTYTEEMKKEIPYDASVAGLKVGDTVTYRDLLYASMLPSGADATTLLAYGIAGSSENFVKLMNEKAKSLGLTNTHFVNVTGYDIPNHYSTPREVLTYLLYALNNPLFKEIYETKNYTLTNGLLVISTISKYQDRFSYDFTDILGSKTGYTDNAGLCISALADVNGNDLIILTLGAPVDEKRINHAKDLMTIMDYLKENYQEKILYKKGDTLFTLPVKDSNISTYNVKVSKDITTYSVDEINKDDYSYTYDGLNSLSFRNKKGDEIGTITYNYLDEQIIQKVYLEEDIDLSFINLFKNKPSLLIPYIIAIILLIFILLYNLIRRKKWRR